jgi:hypothetical protein
MNGNKMDLIWNLPLPNDLFFTSLIQSQVDVETITRRCTEEFHGIPALVKRCVKIKHN